jgi:hypothetical protein
LQPLVTELESWMRTERARLSRHADNAKAMDYMLKRWPTFTRFLDDGRICLTNNAAERALRGIALGRKAWLYAGSDRGGERAAVIYTLIGTANSTTSIRKLGSPTCSAASPITRPRVSTNFCVELAAALGIEQPSGLILAALSAIFTIGCVADDPRHEHRPEDTTGTLG